MVTASRAIPASETTPDSERLWSVLQKMLSTAHPTKAISVVGTRRRNEISRRRATSIPIAMTHSPVTMVTYVTWLDSLSIATPPKTAPKTVRVNARANAADASTPGSPRVGEGSVTSPAW